MKPTLAVRLYRACLSLYPGEFRDEYGRELCLALSDRLRDETSALGRFAVWMHALAGIAVEAPIEHLRVFVEDIRYAGRVIRRETAMTIAAVLMLAVGIGAVTMIFSIANALLLRPLPYANSSRLVALDEYSPTDADEYGQMSLPNSVDIRARTRLLADVGVYRTGSVSVRGGEGAEQVPATLVTDGTLNALGVAPELGRLLTRDETSPTGARSVVISDDLFRRRFGGNPDVLGKALETFGATYTIVGVMPPDFHFPDRADAWFPYRADPAKTARTDYAQSAIGRLKPGVTVAQANAEMQALVKQIHAEHQPNNGWIGRAQPMRDVLTADYRAGILTLLAAAGLLLAIACGNVAILLLVRASARRREVAVRTALGATRRRLVRQMVTESCVLGAIGGLAGMGLASLGLPALLTLIPIDLPRWLDFSIDGRVLGFAVLVSLATSVAFGTVPTLALVRGNINDPLKDAGRGATGGIFQRRLRHTVIVVELALSMTLLAGASLSARSFLAVRMQPLGYHASDVLSMSVVWPDKSYSTGAAQRALLGRIENAVQGVPGVESTAFTTGAPLADGWGRIYTVEGRLRPLESMPTINHVVITPNYFRALGIPLRLGRQFGESDYGGHSLIVSRAFADRNFPGDTALGKRIEFGPPIHREPWYTIVGVVEDARHGALKGPDRDTVYLPYSDDTEPDQLLVRASLDPRALVPSIVDRLRGIDRDIAISHVFTLEQIVERTAWRDRLLATLFVGFAGLALALAAAGFYAVLSYTVSLQTHEIGLRMALGATAGGVRAMVLRHAMTLATVGLTLGAIAAVLLAYAWRSDLYQVSPFDPVSYVIAPLAFIMAGALAASLPTRRATRVDPVVALREE